MDDKSCGMAMRRVRKRFEKALKQYSLIADGDKVQAALHGGSHPRAHGEHFLRKRHHISRAVLPE